MALGRWSLQPAQPPCHPRFALALDPSGPEAASTPGRPEPFPRRCGHDDRAGLAEGEEPGGNVPRVAADREASAVLGANVADHHRPPARASPGDRPVGMGCGVWTAGPADGKRPGRTPAPVVRP